MTAVIATQQGARIETSRYKALRSRLVPLSVPIVIVLIWQLATFFVSTTALPTPWQTLQAFISGVSGGGLIENIWVTLQVVFAAFAVSSILGLTIGIFLGVSRFWGDVLGAPLIWTYSLPKITIFPVFLLLFGLGEVSRLAFGAFHGFFPLAIFVYNGIKAVPDVYIRSAKVLNLSNSQIVFRILFPAILPSIFAGLRFCFSLSFLGVVLAEMFGSSQGAGYELVRLISLGQMPEIFALALSLMVIALLSNVLMIAAERHLLPSPGVKKERV